MRSKGFSDIFVRESMRKAVRAGSAFEFSVRI